MTTRGRIQLGLFIAVLVGTLATQGASMAHMVEAYGFANSRGMAIILSIVTVIMSAVFVALAVITPPGRPRTALMLGNGILLVTEWAGNIGVGGLRVHDHMPAGIAAFFGLDPAVAQRLAAFLLAGVFPVLVFIAVYAISTSAERFLTEPAANGFAERVLHTVGGQRSDVDDVPSRHKRQA